MLHRLGHRASAVVVTLAVLAAIAVTGIVDHAYKRHRMNQAEESEWYCEHKQTRCGGPSSQKIEDAWNERERGYQVALGVIALAGATLTVAVRGRR
jgi:hypothetical protein